MKEMGQRDFEETLDKIESIASSIGAKINKKGSWVIKAGLVTVSIIFIGGIIFIWTILKKSIKK